MPASTENSLAKQEEVFKRGFASCDGRIGRQELYYDPSGQVEIVQAPAS